MPGLVIVAATPSADAVAVAEAAARSLRRGGASPRVHVPVAAGADQALEGLAELAGAELDSIAPRRYAEAAAPLVAAAHHSETLDPHKLLEAATAAVAVDRGSQAPDPHAPLAADPPPHATEPHAPREAAAPADATSLVVLPGVGPLSPLTPRYAVRDLLAELELPTVVAVAAGPDALPTARLTVEALRGVGLPIPAVVLTGWPDPPSRVQRDERALLAELSGVAVHHLPDPEASQRWPVAEWLGASSRGDAASGVAVPNAKVLLEPYAEWELTPQGDPRTTPRPRIMEAMLAIVAAEGPMTASRAYALYARAGGGRKLTSVARAPLSSAIYWLAKEEKVALVRRDEIPWQDDDVVRMPDAPPIRVRELGPRTLDEVPLDEIAALMARLRDARGSADPAALKRAVLESYGLTRKTAKADAYLDLALGLLQ